MIGEKADKKMKATFQKKLLILGLITIAYYFISQKLVEH